MKIIDVHTHMDYITQNFQTDVVGCVCCAVKESEWKKIVELVGLNKSVYGAFGIHPWFVESVIDEFDIRLKNLLNTDSRYMVGEIGLDKYKPNMEKQIDVFIKQFDLAVKLKRIVCLHCVGAWDKILHVLKQYKNTELPIIVAHDFNGNKDIIKKLLQYENIYFSFGKNALYDRNQRIEQIPMNKILVESDGKNDTLLYGVVDKIATVKKESNACNIIYNNTNRILKKWIDCKD